MATIVDALNRVARQVSVTQPDSWLTATAAEHVEIRDDFLLEAVDEILQRVDAPSPISASTVLTTDGSETYTLPTDFLRMQRDPMAVYESAGINRALTPISDDGIWTHIKTVGSTGITRYYRLSGYEGNWSISIYKEPTSSQTITVHYVSRNWMANAGTAGYAFTAEDDVLLMPRRLVELGTICRYRHRRGIPYEATLLEFEAELHRYSNDRRVRRKITFGDMRKDSGPWDIPVPDYIPEA